MSPGVVLVVRAVMKRFGQADAAPEDFVETKDRTGQRVHVRQLAIWLCRSLYGLSFPELGVEFGKRVGDTIVKRDHTTMIASVRRIDARRLSEPNVAVLLDSLVAELDPDGALRSAATTVVNARRVLQQGLERAG